MKRLDEIFVAYEFKCEERRLLHLAFKCIRNDIPLYIKTPDYKANEKLFRKVTAGKRGISRRLEDGKKRNDQRREYRNRVTL